MISVVRTLDQDQEGYKSMVFHFKGMHEKVGRHSKIWSVDQGTGDLLYSDAASAPRRSVDNPVNDRPVERPPIVWSFHGTRDRSIIKSRLPHEDVKPSDMEMMKEKFAKLLLGEDMSGGGKGVSSALALSNAITNLAASVFGEQRRLEPMASETKARWKREIDWLLSVTDHIVEFVPSQQRTNGVNMEIMTTKQRTDLQMNIPALRKLDTMLIDCLNKFSDQNEFYYVKKDADKSDEKGQDDKWWLPTVKVPAEGLSESTRKWLQSQKDSMNQVLKAAMAINAQVLSEMEIPENYIESLPKNGRASLGDSIYRGITVEYFDPDQFLSSMDLTSEHKILDLENRIEASIVIWKRKMHNKDLKSSWGSAVSFEKRELFEERAETILLLIKQRFPGISQSALDISKIQYNKDVGHAILESYSRALESLAFTIMSRIEDVLHADYVARNPSQAVPVIDSVRGPSPVTESEKFSTPREDCGTKPSTPRTPTLSDFMGWSLESDQGEANSKNDLGGDESLKDNDTKPMNKHINTAANKMMSYIERLELSDGLRSPTARH